MEKIKISGLPEGKHEFKFNPPAEEFSLGDVDCNGLTVNIDLTKTGSQLRFEINVSGVFILPCDWCTDLFEYPFDNRYEIIFRLDYTGAMNDSDSDDIKYISPKTVFIDLSEEVRDFVLLSVPLKAVPPESKGVCNVCGRKIESLKRIELKSEINPVWEKLLKLKTKEE